MQNISEIDWTILQAQLRPISHLRQYAEQEHNKAVLSLLRKYTQETQCFTEVMVLKDGRLKMAYSLGEMLRDPILGRELDPLPLFLIKKDSGYALCCTLDNNHNKDTGPTELHDLPKDMNPLDDPNFLKLLERKVQEENTDPQIFIPEGFMAFRFQAIWAAGGYDDDHPKQYTVPFEIGLAGDDFIEDRFNDLKTMLLRWSPENFFGNFWIAVPNTDKWGKLTVEPAYANITPSVSQFSIGELKLAKFELQS